MNPLLKLLGSAVGPYISAAVALLLLSLAVTSCVQTKRLDGAQADLRTARAALKNPETKRTWESEAKACAVSEASLILAQKRNTAEANERAADLKARTATAEKDAAAARTAAKGARAEAARIMARKPVGIDACARAFETEKLVREFAG